MSIESPEIIEEIKVKKHYDYIVGIDLGTYSTSVSFLHSDDNDVQTIDDWPNTNTTTYDGRVASSLLYKKEDEDPLWGGDAHKKFYNESTDFFFVPHVKLYLTDAKNQPCSPGDKLSPVKIISDYLQRVHNYCIPKIRKYYDDKKKTEIENESLSVGDTDDIASLKYDFTKDSVRYVFSYPDNEEDGGSKYKEQVTAALIDAGIIRTGDLRENAYESRLSFISDSGATAYYCSTLTSQLKPSLRPYLVCDIGGKNFGISTIIARDLPETGDISSFIDQSGVGCGNLELDRKMGQFLTAKITSTEDADQEVLEKIRDVAFDPVTNKILDQIEKAIKQHEEGVSGIFLSGTIGQDEYLKELVYEKFGSDLKKVMSVQNNEFAVSKGLVQYGIRQRGLMIPYLLQKDVQVIGRLMKLGNEGLDSTTSKTTRNVKKINHKGLDYIIGLDFGTTYSGFAYAPVPKNGDDQTDHTVTIAEVRKWPMSDSIYPKAPSVLFYDENMKYLNKFGYKAKRAANNSEKGVLLTNFKPLLARDFDNAVDDGLLKKLNDNTTVDAIINYIRDFVGEGIKRMDVNEKVDKKRLSYVVTVPSMWSDEAKNTMAVAIRRAGIVELNPGETLDDRVIFITEAEAAALYCQEFFKKEFKITKDQRFMICDCGGGTVDLGTFQVGQENGGERELTITELTSGDGGNCGSAYIDDRFRYYLLERLLKCSTPYDEEGVFETVDYFIKEIKPKFECAVDATLEDDFRIPIPLSLNIPYDTEDPTRFIVDEEFVIPYSEMEREVFMPVVKKVIDLVRVQLKKLPDGEQQLDAILVVGGFGQSTYLLDKLKAEFEGRTTGAIFIGKPPNGALAICRGAVSFGLRPRLVSSGITRYSYGLQVKAKAETQDDASQKFMNDDGEEYCHNVYAEIIQKGERINGSRVYSMKTYVTYPHDPVFAIYSCDGKEGSMETRKAIMNDGLEPIYKLTVKIGKIPGLENAKVGEKVEFEVRISITGSSLEVNVYHNEELVITGVTRVPAIVKTKYVKGTSGEEKKKKWRVAVFSLIKKY